MTRIGISAAVVAVMGVFCLALPINAARAQDITPPGPDETLIYVLREYPGNAVWVAVNDQTVARIKKKKRFAVVHAKAGAITLNLATMGMVLAAVAVDDRPGETVYLKWRKKEFFLTEVDEVEGLKFIEKAKQTAPIDEPQANNERVAALLDMKRLGLDLMRPTAESMTPDDGHAVLTIFRRKARPEFRFGIWSEDRHIGTLSANEGIEIRLPPGEHYFLSGHVGTTMLKANIDAGKRYYAWIDIGSLVFRVKMMPISTDESEMLEDWLEDVTLVELNEAKVTDRVREREEIVTEFVRAVAEDARLGRMDYTELNAEHAY